TVSFSPGDSWLDNWLDQAIGASDPRIRSNTVVALIALGGPKRMAQLARLVGRSALKAKSGDKDAAEVVRSALRESNRSDFKERDRDTLRAALDDPAESFDIRERMAAKTLLLRPDGVAEWFALRRLRPRLALGNILAAATRSAVGTSIAVCGIVWGLAFFILGISPNLTVAAGTLLSIGIFVLVAAVCG